MFGRKSRRIADLESREQVLAEKCANKDGRIVALEQALSRVHEDRKAAWNRVTELEAELAARPA